MKLRNASATNTSNYSRIPWAIALVMVMALGLTSCLKARFTLEISLLQPVNTTYSMVYYAADKSRGWLQESPVVLTHGKFSHDFPMVRPALVTIFLNSNSPALIFYAERGDKITITGDNPSPATWSVGGNKINEALSQWRSDNRDLISLRDKTKINESVRKYVESHSDEASAALILFLYYDRGENPRGFDKLYKQLKGDAADPKWQELTGRCDLITGYAAEPSRVGPIVLRSAGTGCDTIHADRGCALIYFSNSAVESRRNDLESLRRVIRERGDSASLPVASVSLETDSTGWTYMIKADSLKGAVQARMPLGFADSDAISYGINRVPLFIVTSGGSILYRGADGAKAAETALKTRAR